MQNLHRHSAVLERRKVSPSPSLRRFSLRLASMSPRATSPFDTKHFMCDESHLLPRISLGSVSCVFILISVSDPPSTRPHYRLSTRPLNWNASPIRALNPSTTSILCGNRLIDSEGSKCGDGGSVTPTFPQKSSQETRWSTNATVCAVFRKTFPSWLEGDFLVDSHMKELSDVAEKTSAEVTEEASLFYFKQLGSLFY